MTAFGDFQFTFNVLSSFRGPLRGNGPVRFDLGRSGRWESCQIVKVLFDIDLSFLS